ncbi:MAG: hypothetical protein HMLKMBBP_03949 [Planctomycetes bacterium]|nr:hypothetical protein [Planctomycetota bacterium]
MDIDPLSLGVGLVAGLALGAALGRRTASTTVTTSRPAGGEPHTSVTTRHERSGGAAPPVPVEEHVRAVLASEGKLAAIKTWRELTGDGLKDAKDAVERLERS